MMRTAMTTRRRLSVGGRFSTRPFLASTAVLLTLTALHGLVRLVVDDNGNGNGNGNESGNSNGRLAGRQLLAGTAAAWEADDAPCRLVRQAADQCAFVRAHCRDEAAGLLPYLTFYYCSLGRALQPVGFAVLVVWLGLLFTTIGIAASDFFSVNLGTIASLLGLSESLAGVTFLAFGNGSPDVFSTFAAMGSNSGSMAVGELIGAASFITAVVAGWMALVREFRVSRYTFVRDICFFIAAVAFAVLFLADGRLRLWECCTMIGFYLFYVVSVVSWHWAAKRRKRQRARETVMRGGIGGSDDVTNSPAPYRDNTDEEGEEEEHGDDYDTATVGSSRRRRRRQSLTPLSPHTPDISVLEHGPRIEISSVAAAVPENPSGPLPMVAGRPTDGQQEVNDGAADRAADDDDDDDDERNRHISAEMTSSMRVNRPRGRRSTTATPIIRPSLLGALEFRSVLSSLQRSGTVRLAPIDRRRMSAQSGISGASTGRGFGVSAAHALELGGSGSNSAVLPPHRGFLEPPFFAESSRGRALSSGDVPRSLLAGPITASAPEAGEYDDGLGTGLGTGLGDGAAGRQPHTEDAVPASASASASAMTSTAVTPDIGSSETDVPPLSLPEPYTATSTAGTHARNPPSLHLHIPVLPDRHHGSPRSSPSLSPFPGYTESSSLLSPTGPSRTSSFGPSPSSSDPHHNQNYDNNHHYNNNNNHHHYFHPSATSDVDDSDSRRMLVPKPVRWWPYNLLPPPHVVVCTLFPTLQRWREKNIWDKFVSLISAPTVFLLVITLPVIEMEEALEEDDDEAWPLNNDDDVERGRNRDDNHVTGTEREPREETEWQRYRRSTSSSRSLRAPSMDLLMLQRQRQQQAAPDFEPGLERDAEVGSAPVSPGGLPSGLQVPVLSNVLTKPLPPAVVVSEDEGSARAGTVLSGTTEAATAAAAAAAISAPQSPDGTWNRWLVAVQLFAGPLFTVLVVWANMEDDDDDGTGGSSSGSGRSRLPLLLWMVLGALATSLAMLGLLLWTTTADRRPRWHSLMCFMGFVIGVAWISTVAGEVVGVLKAFGVVAGISEAVLGLTIFAVGNSLGDLVADITVARLGYPVMALSACFGGPMLNILLGIGIGGAWMTTRSPSGSTGSTGSIGGASSDPYVIEVGETLLVSTVTVLLTLVTLLIAVPANGWVMSRRIGIVLICMWVVSTTINVVMEVAGGGWAKTSMTNKAGS